MTERKLNPFWKAIGCCLAVALATNTFFLLVRLGDWLLPRAQVNRTLWTALDSGVLRTLSYPRDVMQGGDQYTDHVTMQIFAVGNDTLWRNALAPRILSAESSTPGKNERVPQRGEELRDYLQGKLGTEQADTYTRFWHGQSTLLGLALLLVPLDGYRALLLVLTLGLIAACAVTAALKGRRVLIALAPLLLVSFFHSGQTRFGQLISYGPAQVVFWSFAWLLIARYERFSFVGLLMLAVLAGALEAFVDMMISPPLAAAVFLAVSGTMLAFRAPSLRVAIGSMVSQSVAWAFGFGATYIAKLGFTCAVLGWHAVLDPFLAQLRFRVGLTDPHARMPTDVGWFGMIWENMRMLSIEVWHLGYTGTYSYDLQRFLQLAAIAGWIYAGWCVGRAVYRTRRATALVAGGGYIAASVFVLSWVAAFPEHTWRHLWIMSRAATIWLAGGWGWALAVRELAVAPESRTIGPREIDTAPAPPSLKRDDESAHGIVQHPDSRQEDVRYDE